jgi:hypothetical protein
MAAAAALASALKNLRTAAGSEGLELVFALPVGYTTFYLSDLGVPLSRNRPDNPDNRE